MNFIGLSQVRGYFVEGDIYLLTGLLCSFLESVFVISKALIGSCFWFYCILSKAKC